MQTEPLIVGAICLMIGAVMFIWGFAQLQEHDWNPRKYVEVSGSSVRWEETGGYQRALYVGLIGGAIIMCFGIFACIYGAAAKEEGKKRPRRKS